MTIGERIKNRRKELGMTQIDLAHKLGYISKAAISTVENDKEDMTTTRLAKFAKALDTSSSYLMGWTEDTSVIDDDPLESSFDFVSESATNLIKMFEALNEDGQKKLIDYADDLIQSNKYQKQSDKGE